MSPRLSQASIDMGAEAVRASEIPMLLDISPYGGPHALWQRKVDGRQEPPAERLQQRIGHLLESATRELTAEREQIRIRENAETRRHRSLPLVATPDGFVDRPAALYEGKTRAFHGEWGEPGDPDGVPPRVRAQVGAQLAVWGKRRAIVGVLIAGSDPRAYWIERDRELVEAIQDAVADFWPYVLRREPPPVDGSDDAAAWLRRRFRAQPGSELVATSEQALLVEELRAASFEAIAANSRVDAARNQLMELLVSAEAEVLLSPAGKVTWRLRRGQVGWKHVASSYRQVLDVAVPLLEPATRRAIEQELHIDVADLDALESLYTGDPTRVFDHPFDKKAAERSAA